MENRCRQCGAELSRQHVRLDWDAVCSECGELAWLAAGDFVVCEVTEITPFGVIVRLGDGVEGKIHISELTSEAIKHPADVVSIGTTLEAKVLRVFLGRRTVGLSSKRASKAYRGDSTAC